MKRKTLRRKSLEMNEESSRSYKAESKKSKSIKKKRKRMS